MPVFPCGRWNNILDIGLILRTASGVFATGEYDEDDKEADAVWDQIDNFMDERRRVRGAVIKQ